MTTAASHRATARRTALFGIVAATLLPLLYVVNGMAELVRVFGLDRATATQVVNLLIAGAGSVVAAIFPALAPYIALLQSLLTTFGAEYVISF
jgi:hypothetical protein